MKDIVDAVTALYALLYALLSGLWDVLWLMPWWLVLSIVCLGCWLITVGRRSIHFLWRHSLLAKSGKEPR